MRIFAAVLALATFVSQAGVLNEAFVNSFNQLSEGLKKRETRANPEGSMKDSLQIKDSKRLSHFVVKKQGVSPKLPNSLTYFAALKLFEEKKGKLNPHGLSVLREQAWHLWNSPQGTAKLFSKLELGSNYYDAEFGMAKAKAEFSVSEKITKAELGDLVTIQWREGKAKSLPHPNEAVMFMGFNRDENDRITELCYMRCDEEQGCSERCAPRTEIYSALFSRLEKPENFKKLNEWEAKPAASELRDKKKSH